MTDGTGDRPVRVHNVQTAALTCYNSLVTIPEDAWRKSSYCGTNACVEVAHTADGVLMRDSKNPGQTPLTFTAGGWAAFLDRIRAGEFELASHHK